jgi:hypothetical protein
LKTWESIEQDQKNIRAVTCNKNGKNFFLQIGSKPLIKKSLKNKELTYPNILDFLLQNESILFKSDYSFDPFIQILKLSPCVKENENMVSIEEQNIRETGIHITK